MTLPYEYLNDYLSVQSPGGETEMVEWGDHLNPDNSVEGMFVLFQYWGSDCFQPSSQNNRFLDSYRPN